MNRVSIGVHEGSSHNEHLPGFSTTNRQYLIQYIHRSPHSPIEIFGIGVLRGKIFNASKNISNVELDAGQRWEIYLTLSLRR